MNIEGINLPSTIVPFTTEDNYATHDEQYGKGGYRTVSTVSEMNTIPSQRRKEGMLVRVAAEQSYYILKNGNFVKEEFGGSGGTGDTTLNYIGIDYMRILEIYNNTPDDSSAIINLIGQENLNRMFSEDGCLIKFINFLQEGTTIYTKCYMRQLAGEMPTIVIPVEFINLAIVIANIESSYAIEITPFLEYDSTLNNSSNNAPKTSTVYNELQNKAGVYRTSLKLGEIENRYVNGDRVVTTAQLNELQNIRNAWINNKVVIINDETGQEFYHGIVQYATYDDSSSISVSVMDSFGNLRCFTFDGSVSNPEWDIHGVEVGNSNVGNTNIKYLTTLDLFNRDRNRTLNLNANDVAILNSLFKQGYKNTQLYYIGSPTGDNGIFPVNVSCMYFENNDHIVGEAKEQIFMSILDDTGIPVYEFINIYSDSASTAYSKANVSNSCFSSARYLNGISNGYEKFNDGLMICWGEIVHTETILISVALPTSFIDNSYKVVVTPFAPPEIGELVGINVTAKTNSRFTVAATSLDSTGLHDYAGKSNWIAIGRWK